MYEVTVTVEAKGTVFDNAVYRRKMAFVFHDLIEAERLKDHCRTRGFTCSLVKLRAYDAATDAIADIKDVIKEMTI